MVAADESFALKFLKSYFVDQGLDGCHCEVNKSDPPDIVVIWNSGERWGVEVARVYQRVNQVGPSAKLVSSKAIEANLRRFSDEIEDNTRGFRRRDYLICFNMPGPLDPWNSKSSWNDWKRTTGLLIQNHIEADLEDDLTFLGGVLRPGDAGQCWRVMIGSPPSELRSAITEMLRHVIEDKSKDMKRWGGAYAKRWLLLLNCFPLADDFNEVEEIVCNLDREHRIPTELDGIFWSGFPDRRLAPIFFSKDERE